MKKLTLIVALLAAFATVQVSAFDCDFGVWQGTHEPSGDANLRFGLPASVGGNKVTGLEMSLVWSASKEISGVQWTWFGVNNAETVTGVQLSFVNWNTAAQGVTAKVTGVQLGTVNYVDGDVTGLQWGAVNFAKNVKGLQLGIVNFADNALFQVGLADFNKNGFLPFFVILNFSKDLLN